MGIQDPTTQAARVTSTIYYSGNLLTGTASGDYTIRDTSAHNFRLLLAADGVVDMGILLHHDLTIGGVGVDVKVQLYELMDLSAVGGSASSTGISLVSTNPGDDDLPSGGIYSLLPEVSPSPQLNSVNGVTTLRTYGVPELRGPLGLLMLRLTARAIPDAGSAQVRVVRRY